MTLPAILVPVRAGTDVEFQGAPPIAPRASSSQTVALIITKDWGLGNQVVAVSDWADFLAKFGDTQDSGYQAVASAIDGQGLDGAAGAGSLMVYRQVGSDGAAASVVIHNTAMSPAAALTLTAIYKGTKGNSFSYSIAADPVIEGNDVLTVIIGGVPKESYSFVATDITSVAAAIAANQNSEVVPSGVTTGVSLHTSAGTSFTGGNDGSDDIANGDVLDALAALTYKSFSHLAFEDLTDDSLQAAVLSWVQAQSNANRPVQLIVGGDSDDTSTDAITRSALLADPHVVNLGVGTYLDSLTGNTVSTSQLAPRVAGALAQLGLVDSGTFARFGSLTVVGQSGPQDDEIDLCVAGGVTIFTPAVADDATTKIEQCLTTYTANTDALPYAIFSDPRLVSIMDTYVLLMKQWGDANSIGRAINADTLSAVKQKATSITADFEGQGLIVPASDTFDIVSPQPNQIGVGNLRQAIVYDFGFTFAPTNLHLLARGSVG